VPAGVTLLTWLDPRSVRIAVGVFLVIYSVYAFLRPTLKPVTNGGAAADGTVGFLSGVLGGLTGLAGILVTIWCGLRGWPKDVQRSTFQPAAVAIFLMSALWLGAKGTITPDMIKLFVMGLPWRPRRNLAGAQTLRENRRSDISEDRTCALVPLRSCVDPLRLD